MSVYIPHLELPNKDYGEMVVTIYPNGSVVEYLGDIGRDFGTAIHVPAHGRLIDADALMKDGWKLYKEVMRMGGYAIHEMPLNYPDIPTIIPAEEGE